MIWNYLNNFLDIKCERCENKCKWISEDGSKAYCQDHFPFFDIEKSLVDFSR